MLSSADELVDLAPRPPESKLSLCGHLALTCSADELGRSFISHQSFRAPFHISKPYRDEHVLVVQVVNPTAGLFAGDVLRCEVRVESGARLRLTTPSASRVHSMPSGRAILEQAFHVVAGGWLDYSPAPLIPQRGCRYRQTTRIAVEPGGELFFLEIITPGRVAHGEWFQYSEMDWECDLRWSGRLIARERFVLQPNSCGSAVVHEPAVRCSRATPGVRALQDPFPRGYYASGYLIVEATDVVVDCLRQIRELNSEDVLIGVSRLVGTGWGIKILARDSLAMGKTINSVRRILAVPLPQLRSDSRMF